VRYQLGVVDIPTIMTTRGSGPRYTLEFDSPPDAEPGETYRTRCTPLSVCCDAGGLPGSLAGREHAPRQGDRDVDAHKRSRHRGEGGLVTAAEAVEYVRTRVALKNPALPGMKLEADLLDPFGEQIRLMVKFIVPHRDTGECQNIYQAEVIAWDERMPADYFSHIVADFVRRAFVHEFSECFHVDGERVFDPHQGETP
jgi:hypothetical protein